MASGETLLKVTDFPFSYSILILIFGIWQIDISNLNLFILIGTAGALGTFLSISDPLGWMYRRRLKRELLQQQVNEENNNKTILIKNSIKALKTRAIKLETDKLVSIGYFVIILFTFGTILAQGDMADRLVLTKITTNSTNIDSNNLDDKNEIVCDQNCIRYVGFSASYLAMFLILWIGKKDWQKLKDYIETAAIHQLAISSENVTDNTVENLSRSMENNDWQTAKEWADLALHEINIQKGKKDQIINAVEQVYTPLYLENVHNETAGSEMKRMGEFRNFQRDAWLKIKSTTAFLRLEDEKLRKELESFYEKITRYNELPNAVLKICEKILKKRIREFYGENVNTVHFFIKTTDGSGAPSLTHLLPFGRHPLDVYTPEQKPELEYIQLMKNDNTYEKLTSKEDFEKFEEFYDIVKDDVKKDETLLETKKLYEEITSKNKEFRETLMLNLKLAFKI